MNLEQPSIQTSLLKKHKNKKERNDHRIAKRAQESEEKKDDARGSAQNPQFEFFCFVRFSPLFAFNLLTRFSPLLSVDSSESKWKIVTVIHILTTGWMIFTKNCNVSVCLWWLIWNERKRLEKSLENKKSSSEGENEHCIPLLCVALSLQPFWCACLKELASHCRC